MKDIGIRLRAKNSSGEQVLYLTEDEGEYAFTLCGMYEGEEIQVDFDVMTRRDLEDMRTQIDLILSGDSEKRG